MYVSLVVVYVGVTLWTCTWVALLLLAGPLWLLARVVIPMEEAQLSARFGEDYTNYCRRVRRWL
jgi:protein-S-isoprenylcysteine O-methyltransferase Ste14